MLSQMVSLVPYILKYVWIGIYAKLSCDCPSAVPMVFAIPTIRKGRPSINSSWPMGSTPGKSWVTRSLPIMVDIDIVTPGDGRYISEGDDVDIQHGGYRHRRPRRCSARPRV